MKGIDYILVFFLGVATEICLQYFREKRARKDYNQFVDSLSVSELTKMNKVNNEARKVADEIMKRKAGK